MLFLPLLCCCDFATILNGNGNVIRAGYLTFDQRGSDLHVENCCTVKLVEFLSRMSGCRTGKKWRLSALDLYRKHLVTSGIGDDTGSWSQGWVIY